MIEVTEQHLGKGTWGRITGLKTAHCSIAPVEGAYQVQTVRLLPNGKRKFGSTRYTRFPTYDAALTYALAYSNRVAKTEKVGPRYIVEPRAEGLKLFDVVDTQYGYTVKSFFTEAKAKEAADQRNA